MHFHKFAFYLGGKRTGPICGHDISNLSLSHSLLLYSHCSCIYIKDRENFTETTTALASLNLEFSGSVVRAFKLVRVRVSRDELSEKDSFRPGDVIVDSRCTYPIIYANFRVRVARFKGASSPFAEILWENDSRGDPLESIRRRGRIQAVVLLVVLIRSKAPGINFFLP